MPQEIFHLTSAGSVDDGKSTILARLLLDTGSVFEDQLKGVNLKKIDATTLADLLDGLDSEREQGITIDVAHRFFDSGRRRYHIADSPGHEQYTRNMATAASQADGMLLVVDARAGVKPQTTTHLRIAKKLGITQFVVAVNKMDLVGYREKVFRSVTDELGGLFPDDGLSVVVIPVSGLVGDNVVTRSPKMTWWEGPTVVDALNSFQPPKPQNLDTVVSVQYVQRIAGGGRRYLGSLHAGRLAVGDALSSPRYPGRRFEVTSLLVSGLSSEHAEAPAEVSFTIDQEVDLERGDVLGESDNRHYTDQFEADLVWLDDHGGLPGRSYSLRLGHSNQKATMTRVFSVSDDGNKSGQISRIEVNHSVRANIDTHAKLTVSTFTELPELGRFVLIDHDSGNTVAVGTINHTLRRADNLVAHQFDVTESDREKLTGHKGTVAWFTGLSGSGKSTLVNEVSSILTTRGVAHAVLDGDALRLGLNKDLGFSEADRVENIRRAAEVAKLMAQSGLVVLVSLISPYQADRSRAAEIIGQERFFEVHVATPLEVCEQRDPKGLYQKARAGLIPNFTGISAPYEEPANPSYRTDFQREVNIEAKALLERLFPGV